MAKLSFGVKAAQGHAQYKDMLKVWKDADQMEIFEHSWLFDHLAPVRGDLDGDCMDGWTLLMAMATETERIRIGLMVAGNTYRHPVITATTASTIDVVSGGRLDFGVGAGWNEYEHHSTGIPLYSPGERLRRFEEACEIWKRLFTQPLTDFDGRYYQLKEARNEPKPIQKPHPPFIIGGNGEKITLRIVAKYADIWSFNGGDVKTFIHKRNVLHQHCADVGRDPAEIKLSMQFRIDYDDLQATVDSIHDYVSEGIEHIILYFQAPWPEDIVDRAAEDIVAKVRT